MDDAPTLDQTRGSARARRRLSGASAAPGPRSKTLASRIWQALCTAMEQAFAARRVFVLGPFAFIAGVVAYRAVPYEPLAALAVLSSVIALAAVWVLRERIYAGRVAALTALAVAGACALPLHGAMSGTVMLDGVRYGTFTATIDTVISNDGDRQRWIISSIAPLDDPRDDPGIRRARIIADANVVVRVGDRVTARMRFYPVPAPIVPGGYDSQFVSYYSGIGAYGNAFGDIGVVPSGHPSPWRWIETLRRGINDRILAVLDDRIGGIAVALITGDQSRLREEDRETMAAAGLAHVLAISGLHLTLVAGTMFAGLRYGLAASRRLAQGWPIKKIAAAFGLLTALAYMVISGMGVPAIRSTIMLGLVFCAVMAGRQALTMRNVAIAAFVVLILDPATVFGPSFQLSFSAVVALIAAYELVRDRRRRAAGPRLGILAVLGGIATTSLVAGFATLVFAAYHFQQTAPLGVLGNLLAMPMVTFVMMPSALLGVLLMPLGLEAVPLTIMGRSIEFMLWVAQTVETLSGGFNPSPLLAPSALVLALIGFAWLAFFTGRLRLLGPVVVTPLILIFATDTAPDILIADTSQAVAVRHGGRLALIDGRTGTFATDVWSERYLEPIGAEHDATRCGPLGCFLSSEDGYAVALVEHAAAYGEDCRLANVVIGRVDAPTTCARHTQVITPSTLSRDGAQALAWNAEMQRFVITPSVPHPDRPWRPTYGDAL